AFEHVHAPRVVGTHAVRFDLDRLRAVGLLGVRQGGAQQQQPWSELHGAFFASNRARTSARRKSSRVSVRYSMPRPVSQRPSCSKSTSRSVRTSALSRRMCRKLVVIFAGGSLASASRSSTTWS